MTPVEQLSNAFVMMHRVGASRHCASSEILRQTFMVNGIDSRLSIIAAISSMGGAHAPVVQAQLLLQEVMMNPEHINEIVSNYNKIVRIPGFGSGFIKGEPDPIHQEIDEIIKSFAPKVHYRMMELMDVVHEKISDKIFFNSAMYSAAFGIIMNIPAYIMPGVIIEARINIWNRILTDVLNQPMPEKQNS